MKYRLAPVPGVALDEVLVDAGHSLMDKRVIVRAAGYNGVICRVRESPSRIGDQQVLHCAEQVARKLGGRGREFEADIKEVSDLKALWVKADTRLVLLTAGSTAVVGVLSFLGLAVPDDWTWWPTVPGGTAAAAAVFLATVEAKGRLP